MKGINLKNILSFTPEILLLLASGIYFIAELIATSRLSYPAIACALIVLILVILKNKVFAILLSVILGLVSIYMLLAVLSEYSEFPRGDLKGTQLLLVGSLLFTSLLTIALTLPKKYLSK
jgi:hypothetical protein